MEFPKNWKYDKGTHRNTIARANDRKNGITTSVQKIDLIADVKNGNDKIESVTKDKLLEKLEIE